MVTMLFSRVLAFLVACGYCILADVSFSNFTLDNEVHSSFIQRRLRSQERREMQREILSILGLPHRPRPHIYTKQNAAPMFMMDLYNSISTNGEPKSYSYYNPAFTTQEPQMIAQQDSRFLNDADMVMSFVNLGTLFLFLLCFDIFTSIQIMCILSVVLQLAFETAYSLIKGKYFLHFGEICLIGLQSIG